MLRAPDKGLFDNCSEITSVFIRMFCYFPLESPLFGDFSEGQPQLVYRRIMYVIYKHFKLVFNPIALRTAKTLWSFGRSECNRVKSFPLWSIELFLFVYFGICGYTSSCQLQLWFPSQ